MTRVGCKNVSQGSTSGITIKEGYGYFQMILKKQFIKYYANNVL